MSGSFDDLRGHISIDTRRSNEAGDLNRMAQWLAGQSQAGMRPHIKGSLLVTSGIVPPHIAANTLVG